MDDETTVMGNVIKKGEVNGSKVSNALDMLGIVVLNVVHVLHT